MTKLTTRTLLAGGAALALALGSANAATSTFDVVFGELNDSGVSGSGTLVYTDEDPTDDVYGTLQVDVSFTGLDSEGPHPMHIHGLFAGGATAFDTENIDSTTPDEEAADAAGDGDGFLETVEGVPAYGDVLLSMVTNPGGETAEFMSANEDGTMVYSQMFDLSDSSIFLPSPATETVYSAQDLFPLVLREMVIHGLVVADGAGSGEFELSGDNCPDGVDRCYVALLPVAAAEIMAADAVPLPGAALLFLTAGAAGGVIRHRKKA